MKLQEKHKEFAVKSFARFMTRTEVVKAFMEEFEADLPSPSEWPKFDREEFAEYYNDEVTIEQKHIREERITQKLISKEEDYRVVHGADSDKKFEQDRENLREEIRQELYETEMGEFMRAYYGDAQADKEHHFEDLTRNLSNQLRRLNITHPRFPNKYRDLFNQTREEYFNKYRTQNLGIAENVLKELETLHGYVKQAIFQEQDPKEAMKHINLAHQILKTIVAHNAIGTRQEIVDITPNTAKALQDSQQALTEQLQTLTQQLAENTSTPTRTQ